MSKNEEGVARLGVDDWETVNLVLDQHLNSIVQATGRGEGREHLSQSGSTN